MTGGIAVVDHVLQSARLTAHDRVLRLTTDSTPVTAQDSLSFRTLPPKGFNGKPMALLVGGSLLLGTIVFAYILWLYGEVEKAHAATSDAWRTVAVELAPRYERLEKLVADGVDGRQIAIELGEQFRLRIETFRATGQANQQVAAVNSLEELLAKIDQNLAGNPGGSELEGRWRQNMQATQQLSTAIATYNDRVRIQKKWRSTFGGALLLAFIQLSEPEEIQVIAVLSNSRIQ